MFRQTLQLGTPVQIRMGQDVPPRTRTKDPARVRAWINRGRSAEKRFNGLIKRFESLPEGRIKEKVRAWLERRTERGDRLRDRAKKVKDAIQVEETAATVEPETGEMEVAALEQANEEFVAFLTEAEQDAGITPAADVPKMGTVAAGAIAVLAFGAAVFLK